MKLWCRYFGTILVDGLLLGLLVRNDNYNNRSIHWPLSSNGQYCCERQNVNANYQPSNRFEMTLSACILGLIFFFFYELYEIIQEFVFSALFL